MKDRRCFLWFAIKLFVLYYINRQGGQGESALFSDEESIGGGESSHGEEDEEEESEGEGGETADEHDEEEEDEFSFAPDDQLERRQSSAAGLMNAAAAAGQERTNLAPQHMQWALRPRPKIGRASSAAAAAAAAAASGGGGFIYIDPTSLRRTSAGGAAAAAAVAAAAAGGVAGAADSQVTMYTTASALARAYGVVIRQVADLLTMLQDYAGTAPCLPRLLSVGMEEFYSLLTLVEEQLRPNWTWLMTVMDSTEAQLRFGSALSNSSDSSHPLHPLYTSSRSRGGGGGVGGGGERSSSSSSSRSGGLGGDPAAGRRDFLHYALSLMRAHHSEHSDSLPIIDVSAMRHIAYAFDALIYYMRAGDMSEESNSSSKDGGGTAPGGGGGYLDAASAFAYDENDNDDDLQDELPVMATVRGSMEVDDEDTNQSSSNLQPPTLSAQKARRHNFFVRSGTDFFFRDKLFILLKFFFLCFLDSTLCLGCPPPDPFTTPMQEALPLADQVIT